jgi:hypothetical protein
MKIRPVGTKLFYTDRHDESNSRFSQLCETCLKMNTFLVTTEPAVCPHTVHTVRSESPGARRLWYVDLVVSIEVSVEGCCCYTVFSC